MNQHSSRTGTVTGSLVIGIATAVTLVAIAVIVASTTNGPGEQIVTAGPNLRLIPPSAQPESAQSSDNAATESSLLNATVPVGCTPGRAEWLTLIDGTADRTQGPGGVIVTATAIGDIYADGTTEAVIAVREFCGGESAGPVIIVKRLDALNEQSVITVVPTTAIRPMGEIAQVTILPANRLRVDGQVNEARIINGRIEQVTEPTPPQQFLFETGSYRRLGPS